MQLQPLLPSCFDGAHTESDVAGIQKLQPDAEVTGWQIARDEKTWHCTFLFSLSCFSKIFFQVKTAWIASLKRGNPKLSGISWKHLS